MFLCMTHKLSNAYQEYDCRMHNKANSHYMLCQFFAPPIYMGLGVKFLGSVSTPAQ